MLTSHLRLGLPSGLFLLAFLPKFLMHFSFVSGVLHAPPPHPAWFHHPFNIWWSSSLYSVLQPPATLLS